MSKTSKIKKAVVEYAVIILIAAGLALMYQIFIIPNDFAPAGLNGIATMIQYKFNFSIGYFSIIINIPLCVLAYFVVSKRFAVRSLVFCLTYSGVYLVLQQFDISDVQYDANGVDTIFPCLIAGLFSGFVYGVCARLSASTGGTDIVSKAISVKKPFLNFFWITFVLNAVVAVASLFVYGTGEDGTFALDYKPACLCILYCFMSSFLGNKILQGTKGAYQFIIVTQHSEQIEKEILETLHHSATRLHGTGVYSDQGKDILMCVVNKHQVIEFKNILKKYPDTFAFIEMVNETVGNFKKIK